MLLEAAVQTVLGCTYKAAMPAQARDQYSLKTERTPPCLSLLHQDSYKKRTQLLSLHSVSQGNAFILVFADEVTQAEQLLQFYLQSDQLRFRIIYIPK